VPPAGSTPYSGTAIALPGTIQAEHYDRGGEKIAYHDTTAVNSGVVFRTDGVDLAKTTDSGGGYTLGWTQAGEWLNYTVNVTRAGIYTIDLRVASSAAGGKLHIEIDGVDVTGSLATPATGGWQTWKTISKPAIAFAAGKHVVKLVFEANGATGSAANVNWIAVR
jgi:hypothetical protein